MSRVMNGVQDYAGCFPRSRGDEPKRLLRQGQAHPFSPLTRG